jgi:hypothetical protein
MVENKSKNVMEGLSPSEMKEHVVNIWTRLHLRRELHGMSSLKERAVETVGE